MTYFITGGTGSFGKAFTNHILETTEDSVVIFSRDELKQWEMAKTVPVERVTFVVGDVRDYDAVLRGMDIKHDLARVIHAAALKHVHTGEMHPEETYRTNVEGTRNVMRAAKECMVRAVLISSDKAVEPVNAYGASKMMAEYIARSYDQWVVRWGNVFGSRGSILHIFQKEAAKGRVFTITDHRMTRFVITLQRAVEYCLWALEQNPGIYYPTLPAMRIPDLARAFEPNAEFVEIGAQPGEKLAESLDHGVTSDKARMLTIEEIKGLIDETL